MSTKQIEALKLALEALEAYGTKHAHTYGLDGAWDEEITRGTLAVMSIREALAEQPAQQQEPWGACVSGRVFVGRLPEHARKLSEDEGVPIQWLYTSPQPAQQQEPVLWQILNGVCHAGVRSTENLAREAAAGMQKAHDLGGSLAAFHVRPLYTSPPASKPWVGLTDEDVTWLCNTAKSHEQTWGMFVRAIEAKLREKNA